MEFAIDPASPVPPFEQVKGQISSAASEGRLEPGAKLPTVRALAESLGLAANTVAKAYRELERDGVIETRGRSGSFVASTGDATAREAQRAATAFAERMRELRVPDADALDLARAALDASP